MAAFTERDWLTSTDAYALLEYLFPVTGLHSTPEQPRKLRLYYVALARRRAAELPAVAEGLLRIAEEIADGRTLPDEAFRAVNEVLERLAASGGTGCQTRVAECERAATELGYSWPTDRPAVPARWANPEWQTADGWGLLLPFQRQVPAASQLRRARHDPDLLRDIFGNPFDAPTVPGGWRTERVVGLAARCYDDRDFRALPLLADALQEEGGPDDHPAVRHCREEPTSTHARGCWALDLILRK